MNQPISVLYRRYRALSLAVVAGAVMLLSFLWYLPGAYHAASMDEYHVYSWRELRFTNILDIYVLHNLDKHDTPNFVLGGIGVDYPPILSMLIRGTASMGVSDGVTTENYRSSTPPSHSTPQNTHTPIGVGTDPAAPPPSSANVPAYLLLNYAVIFFFGLITVLLMIHWRGAKPWMFAASPILLLYAGYNWDTLPFALSLAALLLLKLSTERPDPGRGYNLLYELAGFALMAIAVWTKLFPVVFLVAALIDRGRRRLWTAGGLGVAVCLILSAAINLPLLVSNRTSWYFYLWFNQNRPIEPSSIWYLLFGTMNLALPGRPDTTVAVNLMSLIIVGSGGLALATLAWRSPRRDIVVPLACALLVWWFSFNKLYDPNFDMWLLFALAILGAPLWLYVSLVPLSIVWYVTAISGLSFLTFNASAEMNSWYVTHVLIFTIIWRLIVLGMILTWIVRKLLTPEPVTAVEPLSRKYEVDSVRPEITPVLQQ